jgi:hypothetical protein
MILGTRTHRIAAVVAAAGLAVGAGAAVAATQAGPQQQSDAIVADAAGQLGISSAKLTAALQKALENQVDAALSAGTITQAQADELKSAIQSGQMPLLGLRGLGGPGGGPGFGHGADLSTAASYLGVTVADLQSSLASGKSLADVAKAQGKSVSGLVSALVGEAKQRLDDAVSARRLTDDERQSILADLQQRIEDLVNGVAPTPPALRNGSAAAPTTA